MSAGSTSGLHEGSEVETGTDEVRAAVRGRVGHLELNRPRALNALTYAMVDAIAATLEAWRDDARVETVLLTGAGERGFCAGGDILALYEDAKQGDCTMGPAFWADEYRLDVAIAEYPKPVVAVMDGLVLGGGIGLSAHASHRVVTERSKVGMPEVGIGFLPDVGGTWLLSHAPGELGTHLALTGGSVGAGDALALGLADSFVRSDSLAALTAALGDRAPDDVLAELAEPAPASDLLGERSWIDAAYAGDDALEIVRRLEAGAEEAARTAAATIRSKSPTSCAVALAALRAAAGMSGLREALDAEYRAAVRLQRGPDFVEGVRAQIVDKDRNPRWTPARLEDLPPGTAADHLAPLGDAELGLA